MSATVVLCLAAAAVVAADVSTKSAALRLPATGIGHSSCGLRAVLNRRSGLAGLTSGVAIAVLVLATAAGLVLVAVADVATATASGIGLAIGGALGNLVDRLRRGGVVDFVVVGRWPPFNLADVALVSGVLVTSAAAIA